jgi:hypothetical protein
LLVLPGQTFFREPDDGWSVRFRVENTSSQGVYLDLASPTLVYPNQFGPVLTSERLLVDERRLPDAPLSESERSALEARRAQGVLSPLSAGEQVDIYVPFHGRGAALFAGFATRQMFVSLDGCLDAVRADGVQERLALTWTEAQAAGPSAPPRGGRTQRDTDLVMSMPVPLGDRECRRPRRLVPRGGAAEWPVVVCPAQPARSSTDQDRRKMLAQDEGSQARRDDESMRASAIGGGGATPHEGLRTSQGLRRT